MYSQPSSKNLVKHEYGFYELANKPSKEELQRYYSQKYYQEGKGSYELRYSESEIKYFNFKIQQRAFVAERYLKSQSNKAKSMIDIGCGEGFALNHFNSNGYLVKGLDFSEAGVFNNHPHLLGNLKSGDLFESINEEILNENRYNLVWLQNVLEHVIDPVNLLESLGKLLSPGGVAVITIPNDFSKTQQALLNEKCITDHFWVCPPDHISYFNNDNLLTLIENTGWECLNMISDIPVDWFLFHPASNYINDTSVGKQAHHARISIENYIGEQDIENVIDFFEAAAKLGVGRDITIFIRPKKH